MKNTKTYKVRVRLGFEGEYEITTGTDGYGGATDLQTCIEIDRNQFLNDDTHLLLDAVNASPVYFVLISSNDDTVCDPECRDPQSECHCETKKGKFND